METWTTPRRTWLLLALLALVASSGSLGERASAADMPAVSLHPQLQVHGGTPQQHARLELARARFRDAGLALPDLHVHLPPPEACGEHLGHFAGGPSSWSITICAELDFLFEHELAHAWEAATLDDATRRAFMAARGYQVWDAPDVPWRERGREGVAFIIQQGLSGPPLPAELTPELRSRVEAFELLTGRPDPRR
jgi:hypothetical protein